MVERRFPRAVGSLAAIVAFVDGFFAERGLDTDRAFDTDLVVEELFTNMVRYHPESQAEIAIGLDADSERLTVVIRDFDVEPYDLTHAKPVDVDAPLSQRKPGGLGLHLVRCFTEDLRYEYRDRTSTVTATLRLAPHVRP